MQLSWIPSCQFAGYLQADKQGFYKAENLTVTILPGGPNVNNTQQVVSGAADFTVNKVAALFAARDKGLPLKAVAQFDQRSSFPLVAFKSSGIQSPQDLKGKKIGLWYDGDEFEVLALLDKFGIDPKKDVTLLEQGFTVDPFLQHKYDVSMVTTFDELNVIRLHGVSDSELNIINPSDFGITIPHGALIANESWLKDHHDAAVRFVRATMKGWDYAFAHQDETADLCAQTALAAGGEAATKDLKQLETLMLGEMQKLQFPEGFPADQRGKIDPAMYQNVAQIVQNFGFVKNPVDIAASYDASIWKQAATG
jgi:NitT/TauT family transport system substrate-binding protein